VRTECGTIIESMGEELLRMETLEGNGGSSRSEKRHVKT